MIIRINTSDKRDLAKKYGVTIKTFNDLISDIPELQIFRWNKLLTPKQVKQIFKHLKNKNILPLVDDYGRKS